MRFSSIKPDRIRALIVLLALVTLPALAQKTAPAAKASPTAPAEPDPVASSAAKANSRNALNERQVPYEELKNRIGQRIIIRTTHHTTRSGILNTFDNYSIDITTDKEQGGFALTVPKETIQSVSIMLDPIHDDPLFPTTGKPGAKTN